MTRSVTHDENGKYGTRDAHEECRQGSSSVILLFEDSARCILRTDKRHGPAYGGQNLAAILGCQAVSGNGYDVV